MAVKGIPDSLKLDHQRDRQRAWMIRKDRTSGLQVSTAQLACILSYADPRTTHAIYDLLGPDTCDAVYEKHSRSFDS